MLPRKQHMLLPTLFDRNIMRPYPDTLDYELEKEMKQIIYTCRVKNPCKSCNTFIVASLHNLVTRNKQQRRPDATTVNYLSHELLQHSLYDSI